jgi:hypothetical protein
LENELLVVVNANVDGLERLGWWGVEWWMWSWRSIVDLRVLGIACAYTGLDLGKRVMYHCEVCVVGVGWLGVKGVGTGRV